MLGIEYKLEEIHEYISEKLEHRFDDNVGVSVIRDAIDKHPVGLLLSAANHSFCTSCGQETCFVPVVVEGYFDDERVLHVTSTYSRQHGCGAWLDAVTVAIPIDDVLTNDLDHVDESIAQAIDQLGEKLSTADTVYTFAIDRGDDSLWIGDDTWGDLTTVPIIGPTDYDDDDVYNRLVDVATEALSRLGLKAIITDLNGADVCGIAVGRLS